MQNMKLPMLFVCLIFYSCAKLPDVSSFSDVTIASHNGNYNVIDQFSHKELGKFTSADAAIQFSIDAMNRGGSINILSGRYELYKTIHLTNGITLRGSGRRTELIVMKTDSSQVGITAINAKEVTVTDLSIIAGDTLGSVAGISYDHCGDCEMDNIYAEGFSKYGIWLKNNSFLCHINNCTAADNAAANIYTDSLFWSRAGEFMPNLITNCITYGGGNGIETNKSIVLNIIGCIVHQPKNYGYYIRNISNSVLISGSRTYQTQNDAVVVENSHEINISGNIFCWSRGKGIVLNGVSWGTISGNNIIDSGSEQYGGFPGVGDAIGIHLKEATQSIQITGNNIFNWGGQGIMKYAVFEDESCENNSFTSLNLNFYEMGGVVSKGKNSLVKDIVAVDNPSLQGNPKGPDPLFIPEKLKSFILEK